MDGVPRFPECHRGPGVRDPGEIPDDGHPEGRSLVATPCRCNNLGNFLGAGTLMTPKSDLKARRKFG